MQQLAEILPKMISKLEVNKQFKSNLIIFNWQKIVGNDIALQSIPISVEYGVLFLSVKNSVWSHHLAMMKDEIIYKINNFSEEALVRDIKFKNHLYAEQPKLSEADNEPINLKQVLQDIDLTPQEIKKSFADVSSVSDEAIKSRLLKIYQQNMKLNKYRAQQGWHSCESCQTLCSAEDKYCQTCSLLRRQAKLVSIQRELSNVPWASYGDINRYIECTAQEYIDAKVSLLLRIADSLGDNDEASLEAKTLTMLFNGARYDDLSAKLIKRTVAKFRRHEYVSSSRI